MFVNKERCKNLPVKFECVTHMRADTVLQASPLDTSSKLNMRLTPIICVLCCLLLAVAGKSHSPLSSPLSSSSLPGFPGRAKRDLTCAVKGHNSCSLSCRLRGLAGGECGWNTTSAAYDCLCEEERRGVRCNVGGPNVCHVSCLAIGHTGGECDTEFNCRCSGRRDW